MISILLRFIEECMSMRRYSAVGLYTNMGRYWLPPSTAIEKSVMMFKKLELFPLPEKFVSLFPTSFGKDVCVD